MKKILLTSAGFENKVIQNKFMELMNKKVEEIKALFIVTAAIHPDAIMVLPKCLEDLLHCGILMKNITVYDMHKCMKLEELKMYDVVYVCGGSTSYLVNRMNEVGFKSVVQQYVLNGGIYIGVSAGSVAASGNYSNGLGFIKNQLDVHCDKGSNKGIIETEDIISLTNQQAIFVTDDCTMIIE